MFRKLSIYLMVIAVLLPVMCIGAESSKLIEEVITVYFADAFNLPKSDILLKFLHMPKAPLPVGDNFRYLVESSQTLPRLGYQTVWLKIYDNQSLIQKQQVTIELSICIDALVTTRKLKRGEIIEINNISIKHIKVSRDYKNLIKKPDSAIGLITKQIVNEGELLKRSVLREPPDIPRGDRVTVKLVSGDLVVMTDGKLKEDGFIGKKVKVFCVTTGKLVYGIVQSPQLVMIQLR